MVREGISARPAQDFRRIPQALAQRRDGRETFPVRPGQARLGTVAPSR